MYRECESSRKCKEISASNADGPHMWWFTWKNIRIERTRKNENGEIKVKNVSTTVKEGEHGTLEALQRELINDLQRAVRHVFNIKHQLITLKKLRVSLDTE
jgi:hypothetical protein